MLRWAALTATLTLSLGTACNLLAPGAPCRADSNCRLDQRCDLETSRCEEDLDDEDAGEPARDGGGDPDGGSETDGGGDRDGGPGDDAGGDVDGGQPGDDAGSDLDGGAPGDDAGADGGGPGQDAGGDYDAGLPGCSPGDAGPPPAVDEDPCAGGVCTVRKVGHAADGCPASSAGACDYWVGAQANPIQAAIDASLDGDVVWLYGHARDAFVGPLDVYRSITIEGAPDENLARIRVANDNGVNVAPGLVRLQTDGITLRRFTLVGRRSVQVGITANRAPAGTSSNQYPNGISGGHLLEQLRLLGVEPAVQSNNSIAHAIALGPDTILRNSYVQGWWEGGVVQPSETPAGNNLRVVHNTFVFFEDEPAVDLHSAASGAIVRNNLFVMVNPHSWQAVTRSGGGAVDAVVEGNVYWGYPAVAGPGVTEGANNLAAAPGFADWSQPYVVLGAQSLCGGEDTTEAGAADLFGDARGATVGAVQQPTLKPRAPPVVHIGASAGGCSGACAFTGEDALGRAIASSAPGTRIVMHGDGAPSRFLVDDVVVDRTLTLTVPEGQAPTAVEVYRATGAPSRWGTLTVTNAEDVVLEGFHVVVEPGSNHGVLIDSEPSQVRSYAERAVIRGLLVSAPGANPLDPAFLAGPGTTISDSVAWGDFEALVEVAGDGVTVVNNTLISLESGQSPTAVYVRGASDLVFANNLIDLRAATSASESTPLRSSSNGLGSFALPVNATFASNQFYGVDNLQVSVGDVALPLPSGGGDNCVEGDVVAVAQDRCAGSDPKLVDASGGDVRLASDSPAVNAGDDAHAVGSVDVLGRARLVGTVDVGAVERQPGDP
jgi:hypothetical protein